MVLAEVAAQLPYWNPEITTGAMSLMLTVIGSVGIASWWFTKLFSRSQVSFATLEINVVGVQAELARYKTSQDLKLDAINVELKKQTEILTKQEVMSERILNLSKQTDRMQSRLDRLEDDFGKFRVGSHLSEQAQLPR